MSDQKNQPSGNQAQSTGDSAKQPLDRRALGQQTREALMRDGGARIAKVQRVAPEFVDWTYEAIFGHTYQFPGLDERTRQLTTVTVLAVLGRDHQLRGHLKVALDLGISRETLVALFAQIAAYAGAPAGIVGLNILADLLDE